MTVGPGLWLAAEASRGEVSAWAKAAEQGRGEPRTEGATQRALEGAWQRGAGAGAVGGSARR